MCLLVSAQYQTPLCSSKLFFEHFFRSSAGLMRTVKPQSPWNPFRSKDQPCCPRYPAARIWKSGLKDVQCGAGQAKAEARAGQSHVGNMTRDLGKLLSNPVIVLNLLAFCPLQAVLGAYAFWGPKVGSFETPPPPPGQGHGLGTATWDMNRSEMQARNVLSQSIRPPRPSSRGLLEALMLISAAGISGFRYNGHMPDALWT